MNKTNRKTDVVLTIDTEFSIGGAFADPARYQPLAEELVECMVDGRGEGLPFILATLGEYGMRATFFVEALQRFYFGERRMGAFVERILKAGHDVQVHLHPCWLQFRRDDWQSLEPANDSCAGLPIAEIEEMIGLAFETFATWSVPKPVALRTGGFNTDRGVYRAMTQCGLGLASNIGLGAYRPADPDLRFASGRHLIEGVMEIPALTYRMQLPLRGPQLRVMSITATSASEMRALLTEAHEAGISPVVILTHPFEFIKTKDFRYSAMRRNQINQGRLTRLLEFLAENDDTFTVATFGGDGARWLAAGAADGPLLDTPIGSGLRRGVENLLNDRIWAF